MTYTIKEFQHAEKNFTTTVDTTNLPTRVQEVIRKAAIERMLEIKKLRQYGLTQKLESEGASIYRYFKYDRLSSAYDRNNLESFKYDSAGATEGNADVIEIAKGFQISWEGDKLARLATRAAQTKACVDQVMDREDYKIITALTTSSAVTSTVSGTAELSGNSCDPIKDIMQMKRKVRALSGKEPDVLFIEEENLEELASVVGSNEWYNKTEGLVNSGQLPVFMGMKLVSLPSTKLTTGTAIAVISGSAGCFELGLGHDIRMKIFDDNDAHATKIQVFERIAPAIARPDAGVKLTGW